MTLLISWSIGILSVAAAIFIHAKAIRLIQFSQRSRPPTFEWIVFSLFLVHLLEIALFGIAYYVEADILQSGTLESTHEKVVRNYFYFSIATYTSLGLGDIFPTGTLRLLAGLEVLTGLLMIGWSASFIYVEMRTAEESNLNKNK